MYSFTYTTITVTRYYLYDFRAVKRKEMNATKTKTRQTRHFSKAICECSSKSLCVSNATEHLDALWSGLLLFMLQTSQVLFGYFRHLFSSTFTFDWNMNIECCPNNESSIYVFLDFRWTSPKKDKKYLVCILILQLQGIFLYSHVTIIQKTPPWKFVLYYLCSVFSSI